MLWPHTPVRIARCYTSGQLGGNQSGKLGQGRRGRCGRSQRSRPLLHIVGGYREMHQQNASGLSLRCRRHIRHPVRVCVWCMNTCRHIIFSHVFGGSRAATHVCPRVTQHLIQAPLISLRLRGDAFRPWAQYYRGITVLTTPFPWKLQ